MNFLEVGASKNKNAEMLRVFMPVIVLFLALLLVKRFFSGAYNVARETVAGVFGGFSAGTDLEKQQEVKVSDLINNLKNGNQILNPFSPKFMDGKKGTLITVAGADLMCEQIKDAIGWGFLEPDFVKLFEVFGKCNSKLKIAWLSTRFEAKYFINLLDFLDSAVSKRSSSLRSKLYTLIIRVMDLPVVS